MQMRVSEVLRRFIVPATLALGLTGISGIASADPMGPGGSRSMNSSTTPRPSSSEKSRTPYAERAHSTMAHLSAASASNKIAGFATGGRGIARSNRR